MAQIQHKVRKVIITLLTLTKLLQTLTTAKGKQTSYGLSLLSFEISDNQKTLKQKVNLV